MNKIKEILFGIGQGTTIEALTEELNMNKSLLRTMIEFSVDRGYLKKIDTQHSCANCFLSSEYSAKCCSSPIKMYTLTSKGLGFTSLDKQITKFVWRKIF